MQSCTPDPLIDKAAPLFEKIDRDTGRCPKCGRRHLDLVTGHVLTILKENGLFPQDALLKEVGDSRLSLLVFRYHIRRRAFLKKAL